MRIVLTLALSSLLAFGLQAQEFAQISAGASYSQQAFYTLETDALTPLNNNDWDLAFSLEEGSAGIHYNEATISTFGTPAPFLEIYLAPTSDFNTAIDAAAITDTLFNPETGWNEGALNTVRDTNNADDYGWGIASSSGGDITGNRVFVIKLRDDSYRKIMISSLSDGVYEMKYAALDGTNENTVTIDKADYGDSPLALYSFTTGQATAAPSGWDMVFLRYREPLSDGTQILQYAVTGILTAPGVQVAQANNADPMTVSYDDYVDSLEARIDVIGQDWKYFDLAAFSWEVEEGRIYFMKLENDQVWKLEFIDFEGSSTGTATFIKTDLGTITAVIQPESNFTEFGLFPNPVQDQFNLAFTLKETREQLDLQLFDQQGRLVWSRALNGRSGFNALQLSAPDLPSGLYQMVLGRGRDAVTQPVIIK